MKEITGVLTLYLLTDCDQQCKFCYASKNLGKLSFKQAAQVVDFFSSSVKTKKISLTGGEILLHPEALKIVKYAYRKGLEVNLFTSGSLYTKKRIKEFSPFIKWVTLSLDAPEEMEVKMGRRKSHFKNAIKAINLTKKLYPQVNIRVVTVVTKMNVDCLSEIAEILSLPKTKPTFWRLKQFMPLRLGKVNKDKFLISDKEFLEKTSEIIKKYKPFLKIKASLAKTKSGDLLIVHPDGSCTTTLLQKGEYRVVNLGNFFDSSVEVIKNWNKFKNIKNVQLYERLWKE